MTFGLFSETEGDEHNGDVFVYMYIICVAQAIVFLGTKPLAEYAHSMPPVLLCLTNKLVMLATNKSKIATVVQWCFV